MQGFRGLLPLLIILGMTGAKSSTAPVWGNKACSSFDPCIHLVPHTHLDPGWLNTFDSYFQSQGVGIHEGVTLALAGDPDRRFTFADVAFLVRWLEEKGRKVF